ncbi:hypothetical protein MHO82_24155 [Vibrio sp. Of7-15]|uniref:hypothetical protein n=1 Tax=Vibrio sp. Of7-15 TaxID=2724879 RepID=UPI001EF1F3D5|nr:hypothetical protein [Vibrio sp. Of7-15]MCG7499964.1 hypothetical protein [Vibrio sp. Of7-15]
MTTVKKRFIKANYDRIEDPATTYIPPQEKSEEEKVKSPEFEYAIELACPKEAVKSLQLNQIFA